VDCAGPHTGQVISYTSLHLCPDEATAYIRFEGSSTELCVDTKR
jgi:hypothetical protein